MGIAFTYSQKMDELGSFRQGGVSVLDIDEFAGHP